MKTHTWVFDASGTSFECDLSIGQGDDANISGLCFDIADYDIELIGNAADVTATATGPFKTSAPFDLGVTIPADGGKMQVLSQAVRKFTFDQAGTGAYTVNIVRRISD